MRNQQGGADNRRDLAIASLILGFVVLQLVQCSTSSRLNPQPPTPAAVGAARDSEAEPESEVEEGKKGDETQEEERAKIRGVARALQTIGADPEMRKTYGIKP